jgi:tetratricopeptide (TPR) repeat protein
MADRYTYIPHLGLFAMLAWSADDAVRYLRGRGRGAAAFALAAILLAVFACAARSVGQMGAWRDSVALYQCSLASTPDSHWLHFNLGNRLLDRGDHAAAREHYAAALRLRPGWDLAAGNLAWLLATTPDSALRDPQRAIELAQGVAQAQGFRDPNALDTLAAAYAAAGDFERALALGNRASALALAQGRRDLASEVEERVRGYAAGAAYVAPSQR